MTNDPPTLTRTGALAMLMMVPAIATAVGLTAIEGYRAVRPDSQIFGDPPAETFVAAVVRGDLGLEDAHAFIAAGQDPNALIEVSDENLSGGRVVMVSPLLLAVAARNDGVVEMLLAFGARPDLPQNRPAYCLARALGSDEIAAILEGANGGAGETRCPQRPPDSGAPPLTMIE